MSTQLAWGARVSPEFRVKVLEIAAALQCDASHLMACMAFESGRTFDPAIRNKQSGATGLIQFMPSTARELGTTVEELAALSAVDQLAYVYAYLKPYLGRLTTLADVYMAILWPSAIGKSENSVIFPAGSRAYLQNRGLDVDNDAAVTKAEAASFVEHVLEEGLLPVNMASIRISPSVTLPLPAEPPSQPAAIPPDAKTSPEKPMLPLLALAPLVAQLISVFTPVAQARLSGALTKVTNGDKATADAMAQQLMAIAQQATGAATPLQAVAAVMSDAQAQASPVGSPAAGKLVAQVEQQAVAWLDQMAPMLDKLSAFQREEWSAEEDSRDRAAQRDAHLDKDDMARPLVGVGLAFLGFLILFVCAIATVQVALNETHAPSTEVWAALTGLIGVATTVVITLYTFRFGSTRESAAKTVTLSQLAVRK